MSKAKSKPKTIRKPTQEEALLKQFGLDIDENMKTGGDHKKYWKIRHKKLRKDIDNLRQRSK